MNDGHSPTQTTVIADIGVDECLARTAKAGAPNRQGSAALLTYRVMRPLFHPSIDDITLEGVLHALSDPVRVKIFMEIAAANIAMSCASACDGSKQPVPKSTLSQHFKVLREAGLIRSERRGVELKNMTRCDEVNARFPGLIPAIAAAYKRQTAPRTKKRAG